ncbi:hypothetical protein [Mesorhizobium sp.]|uniref:hypothetical protein n=1 Tax=Mesorhizobium sp. TaxID=1871066 RepID=UPI000FE9E07E|nr:hypothetical protein [Mesorhizobium sp.]RWE92365.1 MAG: hypothetical protein EOS43_31045 [Mesorhizobium sp.]
MVKNGLLDRFGDIAGAVIKNWSPLIPPIAKGGTCIVIYRTPLAESAFSTSVRLMPFLGSSALPFENADRFQDAPCDYSGFSRATPVSIIARRPPKLVKFDVNIAGYGSVADLRPV